MKLNFTFFKKSQFSKIAMLSLVTLFSYQHVTSQSIVERFGRLQVNGSHVTAENGNKISLAGMSLFWSSFQDVGGKFYTAEVVNHLATDWKTPITRAAMGVEEAGFGYAFNPQAELNKVKTVVDAAISEGIYVIIDFHTHHAEDYQREAITFFTEMAETYGDNDHVIYEIYNEPLNTTTWETVKNYAAPVIAAIRSKDPDNLIIVGTPTWSQDVHLAAASPITGDPNLAYTLHFYADSHREWLRDRADQAMNDGIALMATEWGSVHSSGNGGYNPTEAQKWVNWMTENKISHLNWSVSDKDESASIIKPNEGIQGLLNNSLTQPGGFIRDIILTQAETLSVDDFTIDGNKLSISQNPVVDIVTIGGAKNLEEITIYNMNGSSVITKKIDRNNPQINLSSLSTGNYILQVQDINKSKAAIKIIKK
ncbi:cellulase family glycosylhydrolase [Aquimarina sp. RZ0]|uniref:cellulase family glycosylhydrolase n=1 Tax=Aquimarina sp. RZ0 TaxID=2607730 RepID=UPI0011F2D0DE|nr:cellulase family glycosylhydrolase [Aquimarina sp. RZ0]KAA1247041.1 cellulase family glycosylhydrolase [Aquimarina sp. RZ0]